MGKRPITTVGPDDAALVPSLSRVDPGPEHPAANATRSIAANSSMLAGAEIVGKVATFGLVFVAARELPTSTFGSYAVCVSVALLLSAIPAWGFDQQLIQRGSAEPHRLPTLVAQAASFRGGLIVLTLAGATGVVAMTGLLPLALFSPILASSLLDTLTDVGRSAAAARQNQAGIAGALAVQRIVTASVGVAMLVGLSGGARATGLGVAHLIGSIVGLTLVARQLHKLGSPYRVRGTDWSDVATTVRRSAQVGVENVFGMLLFRSDTPLVAALAGSVVAAHYAVTYRIVETTLFLSWTLVNATFPVVAAGRRDPSSVREDITRTLSVGAGLYGAFAAVSLSAPSALVGIFGAEYRDTAGPILTALAFAPLGFFVLQLFATSLISAERYLDSMTLTVGAFTANLVGNLILIPQIGAVGAAITTTAAYAVAGLAAQHRARRQAGLAPPLHTVAPIVLCALAAALLGRVAPVNEFVAMVLAGLGYVALVLLTGATGAPGSRALLAVARGFVRRARRRPGPDLTVDAVD